MNQKKVNKNLKKIISVTKVKSINKLLDHKKIKKNTIKNISNIHQKSAVINNDKKNEKNEEKRLVVSVDREKHKKNRKEINEEKNNLDFNAHFKYNDLVEALTSLKNNKNQNSSITNKEKKINNNNVKQTNYNIISRNVKMNNYVKYLEFIKDSKRVLKVSRKPDGQEYRELAKVTSIGVVIIGVIGFVIMLLGALIGL